jgi:DnaJ-class molecular chaperone
VTTAYDILTDKDKPRRYDRGEIDEDGNPRAVRLRRAAVRWGPGGYRRADPGEFEFGGGADAADLSDLFEGLFSGSRRNGGAGAAGWPSAGAGAAPPREPMSPTGWTCRSRMRRW